MDAIFFIPEYNIYNLINIYNFFIAQEMMSTTISTTQMRSNSFTLTGNTQTTQIMSMTGTSCMTDWLSIPCATNLDRLPSTSMTCVDRLCGGTFNSETLNLNGSSVISESVIIFIVTLSFFSFSLSLSLSLSLSPPLFLSLSVS